MNSYTLNIADIIYSVKTFEKNLILKPEIGYDNFIIDNNNAKVDIIVNIKIGRPKIEEYKLIFDVPDTIEGKKFILTSEQNANGEHLKVGEWNGKSFDAVVKELENILSEMKKQESESNLYKIDKRFISFKYRRWIN